MLFSAGLMVLITVVLVLVHEARSANDSHHHCRSSCGNIHNIRYPFWLIGDPTICGHRRYNLSCEYNQTMLYLYDGRYYVREINYSSYTIRVIDSGIQKDNYSFIPRYSLGKSNFSSGDDSYTLRPMNMQSLYYLIGPTYDCPGSDGFDQTYMVFVNCEKQVKSRLYLDISTCFKNGVYSSNSFLSHSKRYTYVIADQMSVWDLEESCQIEQMSLAKQHRGYHIGQIIIAVFDIFYVMTFTMQWSPALCFHGSKLISTRIYLCSATWTLCLQVRKKCKKKDIISFFS
jgi:hypothetical protein